MTDFTPEVARRYIDLFRTHTMPGATHVGFNDMIIFFNDMTDEQAVGIAEGLMKIEIEAAQRTIRYCGVNA